MKNFPHRPALIILIGLLLASCASDPGLLRPNGVVQAADGNFFVMDHGNHRIAQLSPEGKVLKSIGQFGPAENQIFHGYDLAQGPDGNLYICNLVSGDEGVSHDGVKVFAPDGRFVREIGGQDYDTSAFDVVINKPYGLEIDNAGRVYLADYGALQVRVFTPDGQLLAALPALRLDGSPISGVNDVAVDDERRLLYITDFDMGQVEQFSISFDDTGIPSITHLKTIATYGREPGMVAFPQYITVNDQTGLVYVGDMANRRIQGFDAQGQYQASFAPAGVSDWQNMGVSLNPQGDILVADAFNSAIWIFSPDGARSTRVEVKP